MGKGHSGSRHSTKKRHAMNINELVGKNTSAVEAILASKPATSARRFAKSLRHQSRRNRTFKVKSLHKNILSIVAENRDPVEQVKALGELIETYADYLIKKQNAAITNNAKATVRKAQENYDIAIVEIQEYLSTTIKAFGAQYVAVHGFLGTPSYTKGGDIYEDIGNLTELLVHFEDTLQAHAKEMVPPYTAMMRQVVTELMRVINTSLESVGEKKANNVNALTNLLSRL